MTTKPKFKSDAFEAIHSAAQGLHRAGAIDKATMRDFDESCLATPPAPQPSRIRRRPEHESIDRAEVGSRRQAAERSLAQTSQLD